jgi:hypothetical protein
MFEESGCDIRQQPKIFIFSRLFWPALGLTHFPIQWELYFPSDGDKADT